MAQHFWFFFLYSIIKALKKYIPRYYTQYEPLHINLNNNNVV